MAVRLSSEMRALAHQLRYEPIPRRIRADAGGRTMVDSRNADMIEGHPRDPFHRVDGRASSRRVRVSYGTTKHHFPEDGTTGMPSIVGMTSRGPSTHQSAP